MRPIIVVCVVAATVAATGYSQTLGELDAAQAGMNQLNSGSVTGGVNGAMYQQRAMAVAGPPAIAGMPPTATMPNPSGGFMPPPATGLPGLPGSSSAPTLMGYPGLSAPAAGPAYPMAYGAPQGQVPGAGPTPTPVPMIKVVVGKRVYCAVCGMLLEDAVQLQVPQTDKDKYVDDGEHDNGIKGDGIYGNVTTIKDQFIGAECNSVKNRLINVVRNAEKLDPMQFFRLHFAAIDPLSASPRMPNLLDKEQQRDESLRDWNNKFLAEYRVDKNSPQSEFYQLYVPEAPQPPKYPLPPGYVSPQKIIEGQGGAPGMAPGMIAPTPNIYNGDAVMAPGII